jgi:hypothetical protein
MRTTSGKRAVAAAFVLAGMAALVIACGSGEDDNDPGGTETPRVGRPSPVQTGPGPAATPVETPEPDSPVIATPGGGGAPAHSPTPRPTPGFPTKLEPAPIDDLELIIRESFPPQYALRIVSGLPSGCHQFDSVELERSDAMIRVTVMNLAPDDPGVACTAIYGQHEQVVELGTDFASGTTYRVSVNNRSLEFTAQ